LATVLVHTALPGSHHCIATPPGTLTPTHEGARRVAAKEELVPAGEPHVGEIGTTGTK